MRKNDVDFNDLLHMQVPFMFKSSSQIEACNIILKRNIWYYNVIGKWNEDLLKYWMIWDPDLFLNWDCTERGEVIHTWTTSTCSMACLHLFFWYETIDRNLRFDILGMNYAPIEGFYYYSISTYCCCWWVWPPPVRQLIKMHHPQRRKCSIVGPSFHIWTQNQI